MIRLDRISKQNGHQIVFIEASAALNRGEKVRLVGPNGAGKTTLFNLIAGSLAPTAGTILLEGRDVTRDPPEARIGKGLARTFQIPRPFPEMSVLDNVMLAPTGQLGERFWMNWLRPATVAAQL